LSAACKDEQIAGPFVTVPELEYGGAEIEYGEKKTG
jgi:hypothetical protein